MAAAAVVIDYWRVCAQMWRRRSVAGPAGSKGGARLTVAALNGRGGSGDKDKVRGAHVRMLSVPVMLDVDSALFRE